MGLSEIVVRFDRVRSIWIEVELIFFDKNGIIIKKDFIDSFC